MIKLYTWRRQGAKHFLEIVLGEDDRTMRSWRCWVSLEPGS